MSFIASPCKNVNYIGLFSYFVDIMKFVGSSTHKTFLMKLETRLQFKVFNGGKFFLGFHIVEVGKRHIFQKLGH